MTGHHWSETRSSASHGISDLSLMLGRLLERSDATMERLDQIDRRTSERLDRIDYRLALGDRRMDWLASSKGDTDMSTAERWVKILLPFLIAGGTLYFTGSIEAALKMASGLK